MQDIYDWILSPEVRDYLKQNHVLSMKEKVEIVCGGCRSIEEKYEALSELLTDTQLQEDKDLIQSLLRLYDRAFKELRTEQPGQVFIFMEYDGGTLDEVLGASFGGVDQVFHTYTALQEHLKTVEADYPDRFHTAHVEKWVLKDGKMQEILKLHICTVNGHAFVQKFDISLEQREPMGISFEAQIANIGACNNTLPLPFQNGDLVRIDIPRLDNPVYGVLHIYDALGRYMHLAYIEGHHLKTLNMTYQDFAVLSGWRVIDWTHPAQPSELPAGQDLLAELSDYMHRTDLNPEDEEQVHDVFYCPSKLLVSQTPITLSELLEEIKNDKRIMKVLEEENCWLTFDELYRKVQADCDWVAFAARLEQLVEQGDIQYVLPSGAAAGYYGSARSKSLMA